MRNAALPTLSIQRFSTKDGPGVRTTLFVQGCPLRCRWCHNPESQEVRPQFFFTPSLCIGCGACANVCPSSAHTFAGGRHEIDREACIRCLECCKVCPAKALEPAATAMTVPQIMEEVKKDVAFYGKKGGVTLSGGEPLFHAEGCLRILREAKALGIGTAIETCGYFDEKRIPELTANTDLFLWDIKDMDERRHKEHTGVTNKKILQNLFSVDARGGKTILRCIMLEGVNTDFANLDAVAEVCGGLKHCRGVEIFSYHPFGESKYGALGRTYGGTSEWIVSDEKLRRFSAYLASKGVKCRAVL